MEHITHLIDLFMHLDKHLAEIVQEYGAWWAYVILFLIIFCETGLVIMPLLPGDSLLFAVGALTKTAGAFDLLTVMAVLFVAAVLGDAVNYHIGKFIGPKVFERPDSRFFKQEYLRRTQKFYEKYGGKTIIIARFVPIVRTFAPFLAGVGSMSYSKFGLYNVVGAALWVGLLVPAGYFFGAIPVVQNNFSLVVLGIIFVSLLPAIIEFVRAKREVVA
jgi:membrane-associated protein